ncbi:hypothetical protein Bpfe_015040, partial [Biomphalaria pfeifferi]
MFRVGTATPATGSDDGPVPFVERSGGPFGLGPGRFFSIPTPSERKKQQQKLTQGSPARPGALL